MHLVLCRERRRRQPPKVSGPLAARTPNGAARVQPEALRPDGSNTTVPSLRNLPIARSARPRRHPPPRASHRACARAAYPRVHDSMLRSQGAMRLVLCRERRRRQPPKVSGPLAARTPKGAAREQPAGLRPDGSNTTVPTLRNLPIARSARPRRHPPPRASHRACARAAYPRVHDSMLRSQGAMRLVLCRERRRRQPPKVSGPLAARTPNRAAREQPAGLRPGGSNTTVPTLRNLPIARSARPRRHPPPRASHRACARAAYPRVHDSMLRSQGAMRLVLCRERRRRQPPKVSGPLAARTPNRAAREQPAGLRPGGSNTTVPTLRNLPIARSARPRRHPPPRASHRACARAASQLCPSAGSPGL
ncbi:MAG: hypothetical protein KatS3mg005_3994 [Bryobacteraceae bacterium]|nr:MAG: hypothetical protein KatS3mg005_3994 [Bryobacteraceae bacterium]